MITHIHVHMLYILAVVIIQDRCLFLSELPIMRLLFEGDDYLRASSIQRNTVFYEVLSGHKISN